MMGYARIIKSNCLFGLQTTTPWRWKSHISLDDYSFYKLLVEGFRSRISARWSSTYLEMSGNKQGEESVHNDVCNERELDRRDTKMSTIDNIFHHVVFQVCERSPVAKF